MSSRNWFGREHHSEEYRRLLTLLQKGENAGISASQLSKEHVGQNVAKHEGGNS